MHAGYFSFHTAEPVGVLHIVKVFSGHFRSGITERAFFSFHTQCGHDYLAELFRIRFENDVINRRFGNRDVLCLVAHELDTQHVTFLGIDGKFSAAVSDCSYILAFDNDCSSSHRLGLICVVNRTADLALRV